MRRRLPPLVDAPSVVSDGIFINPKYRGTRLFGREAFDPDGNSEAMYRKPIRVHDARSLKRAPSIEREGFQLLKAPVDVDFSDPPQLTGRYYEHCANLVRETTGCLAAGAMQHQSRTGAGLGRYAFVVHSDFSPFAEDVVGAPEGRHFAIYNVWRGTNPDREIEMAPLAMCDLTTVADRDIVYADCLRRTEPKTRLIDCRLIHDTGQGWYYFPRMKPDEALILKQYDSRREDAGLRGVFHAAFRDPTVREDAPLRQSVEVRVMTILPETDPDRERRKARFQAQVPNTRFDGSISTWHHEPMVDWKYMPQPPMTDSEP